MKGLKFWNTWMMMSKKSIISQLSPELKYQVQSSLSYPEDSAGRIMVREFVSMPDNWTVKEAKQFIER